MSPCPLVSLSPFLYLFLMQLTSVFLNKLTLYISCSVALRKRLPPSLRSSMLTPRSALVTLDSSRTCIAYRRRAAESRRKKTKGRLGEP